MRASGTQSPGRTERKGPDMKLVVKVKEVKGNCPVYTVGQTFTLEGGYQLVADRPVCMHSLASLLPHYNALRISPPSQWGLASREDPSKACFQCLDPVGHTGGGTVVFEVSREE